MLVEVMMVGCWVLGGAGKNAGVRGDGGGWLDMGWFLGVVEVRKRGWMVAIG